MGQIGFLVFTKDYLDVVSREINYLMDSKVVSREGTLYNSQNLSFGVRLESDSVYQIGGLMGVDDRHGSSGPYTY